MYAPWSTSLIKISKIKISAKQKAYLIRGLGGVENLVAMSPTVMQDSNALSVVMDLIYMKRACKLIEGVGLNTA
jgi:hypothetical protein